MKTMKSLHPQFILTLVISFFCLSSSAQTFDNYTTTDGLVDNNVSCVTVDKNGNLWFGTNNGVSKFDGTNWTSYNTTTDTGLVDNAIKCISADGNGNIWVGTNMGASKYDGTSWKKYTEVDGLGDKRVNDISHGPDGKIWFGENDGVSVLDGSTWTTYAMADGLPFGGIVSSDFDSNGDVWLGSGLGGLIHFDGTTFTTYNKAGGLISNLVRDVMIDEEDNKWVATAEGLSVLDKTNSKHTYHSRIFTLPAPDTLNPLVELAMDSHKRVWVGVYVDYLVTEGGISMFEANSWIDFDANDGLIGPVVRGLVVDGDDNVWIATSSGVSKLSGVPVSAPNMAINGLNVYPNPTRGEISIQCDEFFDALTVKVRNALGETISESVFRGQNQIQMDINASPGIYFIEISDSRGRSSTMRLVKSS